MQHMNMKQLQKLFYVSWLLIGLCYISNAQTTIIVNPGQSIQSAVNAATGGTTIRVTSGTYNQKVKFSNKNGSSGNFITLIADAGVILDGTGLSPSGREGMISILNSSYVRVEGFEIQNFITGGGQTPVGILIEGSGAHVQIVNNKIHNIRNNSTCKDPCGEGAHGVAVFGTSSTGITDILIQGNEVYSNVLQASESLVINGNVDRFEVLNNNVHDNNNIGYDFIGYEGECSGCGDKDRARNGIVRGNISSNNSSTTNPWYGKEGSADGFYVDGGQYILFEGNISTGNDLGFEFASEHPNKATEDILMINNYIYNNREVGLSLGGYASGLGQSRRIQVYNNSFYKNKGWGTEIIFQYDVLNSQLSNNIFYGEGSASECYESTGSGSSGNAWGTNLWWGTSSASSGLPGTVIVKDPLYVSPSTGNLNIQSTSPAINAGTLYPDITTWTSSIWDSYFPPSGNIPANGNIDFNKDPRVAGSTIDLGADEYNSGTVTIPTAPSSLSATANSSTQITITWTDNSNNETGFIIERSLSSGSEFAQVATVGSNVTSYVNTGLAGGTTYYFRVAANNSAGTSAYSNVANATTTTVVTIPTAPSSLAAVTNSSSQITLTWADNSNNETGFIIERSLSSGSGFAQVATVGSNITNYVNTGLTSGTTYYYRVAANNSAGTSAYSNVANATTTTVVTIPVAPSSLAAVTNSSSQITLTWTDNSNNETGFIIERSLSSSSGFAQVATVGSNITNYVNTGLTSGTIYYYRVAANNSAGTSAYSNVANATTTTVVTIPVAPTSLAAVTNSFSQITLTWTDNSNNETGFIIERSLSSSSGFAQVATVGSNITNYVNTGLTSGTIYYYRVAANNSAGTSAYSNVANATTTTVVTIPVAPTSLAAVTNSFSQITLTWTDNSNNETGFIIERSLSSSSGFAQVATVGSNITNYVNTGLTSGTIYYYRVAANNSAGTSAYSNVANATTDNSSGTFITVDGNASDWSDVPAISITGNGGLTSLKAFNDETNLYLLVEGTTNTNYIVFINSDNVTTSGYNGGLWNPEGSDYDLENGTLYTYNGTGSDWSWTNSGVTQSGIASVKNSGAIEIKIPRANIVGMAGTIKIGVDIENSSWTTVATIPSQGGAQAAYTFTDAVTIPNPPSSLVATANSSSQISLTWTDNSNNETEFVIERSLASNTGFAQVATVSSNQSNYVNTGLTAATTYYYRVVSANSAGVSTYSNVATATTQGVSAGVITVDGNTSDWSNVPAISTTGSGGLTSLKAFNDANNLYLLVQGTTNANYIVFINSDNETTTGFKEGLWNPEGSDYNLENGVLFKYNGTGSNWRWTKSGVTQAGIASVKNGSVIEIKIPRTNITGMTNTIKIGVDIENSGWTTVATIPSEGGAQAVYTFSDAPVMPTQSVLPEDAATGVFYPNPSNGSVVFAYSVSEGDADMEVSIYDQTGTKVMHFVPDQSSIGDKELWMELNHLTNGRYFVTIRKGMSIHKRMLLIQK